MAFSTSLTRRKRPGKDATAARVTGFRSATNRYVNTTSSPLPGRFLVKRSVAVIGPATLLAARIQDGKSVCRQGPTNREGLDAWPSAASFPPTRTPMKQQTKRSVVGGGPADAGIRAAMVRRASESEIENREGLDTRLVPGPFGGLGLGHARLYALAMESIRRCRVVTPTQLSLAYFLGRLRTAKTKVRAGPVSLAHQLRAGPQSCWVCASRSCDLGANPARETDHKKQRLATRM